MSLARSHCTPSSFATLTPVLSALADDAARAVVEKQGSRWRGRELKVDAANPRAPLKTRVGRSAGTALAVSHAEPKPAGTAKRVAPEELAPLSKRPRPAAQQVDAEPSPRPPRSPMFACTVAVGGLVLTCQVGVTAPSVAAFLSSAGAPACKAVSPCPPEHMLGLLQDGCSGEVSLFEFSTPAEAQGVVALLHHRTSVPGTENCRLWARQLGGEGAQVRRWRLIVRNVSFSATESVLHRLFSTAGFVWNLHIPKGEDGRMRGFAFVAYTSRTHAEQAIATLNGKSVAGRALAVDWALSKKHYDAHCTLVTPVADAAAADADEPIHADEPIADANCEVDEAAFMSHVLSSVVQSAPQKSAPATAGVPPTTRKRMADALQRRKDEAALPKITVFAHNLPPESTVNDVRSAIGKFDPALRCRLVVDKLTGRFKGTAFLEFGSSAAARAAIEQAGSTAGISIHGRRTQLAMAVSKEEARSIGAGKQLGATSAHPNDRRCLYLAREGEILDGSAAAVGVSSADMVKRRRAAEEKAEKLRNPNFSVSQTRLHIRNLPTSVVERELKQLCVDAVRERLGLRPAVTARIMRDDSRLDSSGASRSRGMAFIDMAEHEHALYALRFLNNNPMLFGKERRPIVEFAISDARAVRQHSLNLKRRAQRDTDNSAGGGGATTARGRPGMAGRGNARALTKPSQTTSRA